MRAGDGLVHQQPTADRTAFWIDINVTDFLQARQLQARNTLCSGAVDVKPRMDCMNLYGLLVSIWTTGSGCAPRVGIISDYLLLSGRAVSSLIFVRR